MQRYLYLSLDILSILFPLIFSFYPKAPFYKEWKYVWVSLLIPALIFILWDIAFTDMGVWGFNKSYLTGIYLLNLPLEEILFFICIPYACLFTYFALNHLIKKDVLGAYEKIITAVLVVVLFATGLYKITLWYTATTFLSLVIFLELQHLLIKPGYMGRFYFSFLVILIPFFLVNGVLTGSFIEEPVVWYNPEENLGIRMGTVPVEDTFYGMLLLVMNVTIFEWMKKRV